MEESTPSSRDKKAAESQIENLREEERKEKEKPSHQISQDPGALRGGRATALELQLKVLVQQANRKLSTLLVRTSC